MTFSYSKKWDNFYTFLIKVFVYPLYFTLGVEESVSKFLKKLFNIQEPDVLKMVGYKTYPVNKKE
jgi:hypothetical protein